MRRHSLRLLTTPPIPVPPSLKTSPYLTTSTIFSCGLASPTLPSEEDEKWLQDTIPIPSRHHVQLASASSHSTGLSLHSGSMARNAGEDNSPRSAVTGGVLSTQKSTDASGSLHPEHHHHHRRHLSASESARGCDSETTANHSRTSTFIPPSLAFAPDPSLRNVACQSAVLGKRRWSTGPLRPPHHENAFSLSGN